MNEAIYDHYSAGRMEQTLASCVTYFANNGPDFGLYAIFATSAIRLRCTLRQTAGLLPHGLHGSVVQTLYVCMARHEPFGARLSHVLAAAKQSPDITIAAALFSFSRLEAQRFFPGALPFRSELCAAKFTPRLLRAVGEAKVRRHILEAINIEFPESPTVGIFSYIYGSIDRRTFSRWSEALSPSRRHYYSACRAEAERSFRRAAQLYLRTFNSVRREYSRSASDECNALDGAFRCAYKGGLLKQALDIALKAYRRNVQYIYALDIRPFLEKVALFPSHYIQRDIRLPIIAALYSTEIHLLYILLDNYLQSMGAALPSELARGRHGIRKEDLCLLYDQACTYDVLKRLVALKDADSVVRERGRLCSLSIELGSPNGARLHGEISDLIQGMVVRRGVELLSSSRIYVDESKVLESTKARARDLYSRYRLYRELSEAFRAQSRSPLVSGAGQTEQPSSLIPGAVAEELETKTFAELFRVIRDQFVFGADGLDANLSLYIRHNFFHNQIIGRFGKHHFSNLSIDGARIDIDEWQSRSHFPAKVWARVRFILLELYQGVSRLVADFATAQIRARTEIVAQQGLYDFIWPDREMDALRKAAELKLGNYDDFIRVILNALWHRTRLCSIAAVEQIAHDLAPSVNKLIEQCEAELLVVLKVVYGIHKEELMTELAALRTELQNETATVATWFVVAHLHPQYMVTAEAIVNTAVETIRYQFPAYQFRPACSGNLNFSINGRFFPALTNALTILFENIVKHSGLHGNQCDATIAFSVTDKRLQITIGNALRSAVDRETLVAEINHLLSEGPTETKLRGAGGTGLVKLRKLITSDLNRRTAHLSCRSAPEPNRVQITVDFEMEGLDQ
jgi:hypothetical protein